MRSPRPQHTAHRLAILAPLALVAACKGQPIAIINVDNPSVAVGAIVALVGDKSTDPNGDPLTYRWSMGIPAGSLSTLQAADQSRAWFSPDLPGAYTIQLKVADPSGESAPTTLQINAGPCGANVPALADLKATPAIPATGQVINLSATLSDGDNATPCNLQEALTYHWALTGLPAGSRAALNGETLTSPSFTADIPGAYQVAVYGTDSKGRKSAVSTLTVTANTCGSNAPAVASITATPGNPGIGGVVALTASVSDADNQGPCNFGQSLSYSWALLSAPAASTATLNSAGLTNPSFVPQVPGTYVVGLVVKDSAGLSSTLATQSITVTPTPACGANPPVAKLVNPPAVGNCSNQNDTGCTVTPTVTGPVAAVPNYVIRAIPNNNTWRSFQIQLDATPSTDADNAAPCNQSQLLNYTWQMVAAPLGGGWSWQGFNGNGNSSGGATNLVNPTLSLSGRGTYTVQLTVTDSAGLSTTSIIQLLTQ